MPTTAPPSSEQTPLSGSPGTVSALSKATLGRRLQRALRLWRLYVVRLQLLLVPTEAQRLFALTMLIGVGCGLAAVGFHRSIALAEHFFIDRALDAPGHSFIPLTILTPAIGGLLCGVLLEWVFPGVRGSGIPQVKIAFALRGGRARLRDSFGKLLVGTLQIGTGSSLGREGPTVQICAGIASTLGRVARVSPKRLRRLLPVGAAAGIAAAFNAPIAAVTFTVEEVVGNLDQSVLSGVIVAAALAAVIERSILGEHPIFDVPPSYGLRHASSLLLYALLGLAASIVSVVFTDGLLALRARFRAQKIVPRWAQPALGGLGTGVLAAAGLALLGARGVTGGGYEALSQALTGKLGVEIMLALCALKVAATISSYSSGGAGGIFAPSLFMGGMLGGAFGALDVHLFGHSDDTIGAFALVGMGAVFAGVIRAPITSVLIIIEMTGGYSLILPLMIANMSAYALARHVRPTPIYEALLEQDGVHLKPVSVLDGLEALRVASVLDEGPAHRAYVERDSAREIDSAWDVHDLYPVVDADGRLVGAVFRDDVEALRRQERTPDEWPSVGALMRPPVSVRADDDLRAAFELLLKLGVRSLPVVDSAGKLLGSIDEGAIAKAYLHVQAHGTHHRASQPSEHA
jgi:CIC family chloride channel protein